MTFFENDPYLEYGIRIPVEDKRLLLSPLRERTDRVLRAIRNDQTKRASASVGYLSHQDGEKHIDEVWLSIIMSLRNEGLQTSDNEFGELYIGHAAAADLYDPQSERAIRVTEYVGPLVVGSTLHDQVSNFSILSVRGSELNQHLSNQLTLADRV